jgi:hypothetical protein
VERRRVPYEGSFALLLGDLNRVDYLGSVEKGDKEGRKKRRRGEKKKERGGQPSIRNVLRC